MKRLGLFLAVFMTCIPGAFASALTPPLTGDMVRLEVFEEPKLLPEIMLSRMPQGLTYLSEYRGQVILLNVWATWCPPCVEELPSLNALQLALGNNDFQVLTVSVDQGGPEIVNKYLADNNLKNLPGFVDANSDLQKMKDMVGVPVTFILDRRLRAVARYSGSADWNGRSARAVLEYYLAHLPKAYE